jgi:prepilin-type processing-associated H-X9-DG protein
LAEQIADVTKALPMFTKHRYSKKALASLVCGGLALCSGPLFHVSGARAFLFFVPVFVLLAVLLAILGLRDVHRSGWALQGRWSAILGIGFSMASTLQGLSMIFLLQNVDAMGQTANRMASENNLKQISNALLSYHDETKQLPPAVVRDKDGKPLYSWRVLLLPYIEETPLYKAFRLDEAWDSSRNRPWAAKAPKVYASPYSGSDPGGTIYQAIVGETAGFRIEMGLKLPDDFPNGTSKTILVAEAVNPVPWSKPEDLAFSPGQPLPAFRRLDKGERDWSLFGKKSPTGFNVLFTDGHVQFFKSDVNEDLLRSMLTRK